MDLDSRLPLAILCHNKNLRSSVRKAKDASKIFKVKTMKHTHGERKKDSHKNNVGRWDRSERLTFLRGLRLHGRGKWKAISKTISTRTTLQVKTHAQLLMKKVKQGIYIFEELDEHVATNVTHTVAFGANETGTAQEISFRDEEINTEITAAAHSLIQMASSHIATTECQRL